MKPIHALYGALLLAAAGMIALWAPWKETPGSAGQDEANKERVTTPRRRPKLRLAGHVQDDAGRPVPGATVFVLPKKRPGASRDDVPHEVTDEAGAWVLHCKQTVDRWIGVVAPGYRNAWLDGDAVDPAVQMFLLVKRAPALRVTLVDPAGRPLEGKGIQLEPWPPTAFFFLPGPNARHGEQWGVTDAMGQVTFRRGAVGPVTLTAHAEGFHTHPPMLWFPDARGEARLNLHRNASLKIELRDAATDAALEGLVSAEFFDAQTARTRFSQTESTTGPGVLDLAQGLPPGTYHVRVDMQGRRPWIRANLTVADEGQNLLRARLEPAAGTGRLTVKLQGNTGGRIPPKGRRRAPLTFLLRAEGGFETLGWRPGAPDVWDAADKRLQFELEPGRYHLLVADVITERAALEQEIVIEAGGKRTVMLAMRYGQRGRLPALKQGASYARSLSVALPGWPRVPVYGSTRDGGLRAGREIDVIARALQGRVLFLGPYPADEVTLDITRSDGTTSSVVFR